MLFVHVGKSSSGTFRSSRSQMYFKIDVLKNFSMFAEGLKGLKACIFIKKVFCCEYCEIFKNSLPVEHFLFIILLCDDRIFWTPFGTKLTCFIFFVLLLFSFITLLFESGLHSYFVLVFI